MPKPSEIISVAASLMNDTAQTLYTNAAVLPYFNLALDILQETFEQNDIPVTHNTSTAITLKSGIDRIGFDTIPALPTDLVEILELWESQVGLNKWTPMVKKDFIPHYVQDNTQISMFLMWEFRKGEVRLVAANQDNDLKIDYIGNMFNTPILIKDINVNLPFTNVKTYLEFETAALCAMFIAENETRAQALDSMGGQALSRSLGIPIKGMQSVTIRRRPFRFNFKHRGISY